jgi:hypothetical protein
LYLNNLWIKKGRFVLIVILWMLMTFSACGNPPVPTLLDATCELPCWKNIHLGEATKEEAVSILKTLPEVDPTTITLNGKPWNIFEDVIYFGFKDSKVVGRIYFSDGKASFIEIFHESNRELSITFEDAVSRLGVPQYIINIPMSGGLPLAPTTSHIIIAVQPEQGFGFDFDTRNQPTSQKAELRPDNKLRAITFFDPEFFDQLLEAGFFSLGKLYASETRKFMTPWDGYGVLREKYPPAVIK